MGRLMRALERTCTERLDGVSWVWVVLALAPALLIVLLGPLAIQLVQVWPGR